MKNKPIAILLILCLLLTSLPATTFAQNESISLSAPVPCIQTSDCSASIHKINCPFYKAPVELLPAPFEEEASNDLPMPELPAIDPDDEDESDEKAVSENISIETISSNINSTSFTLTKEDSPSFTTTLTISSNDGDFSTLQAALDSLTEPVNGSVLLLVKNNLPSSAVYQVPADKGITSLTIGTDNPAGVEISAANLILFANGVPLTIDSGVTFDGKIFGGSDHDLISATSITVNEGAKVSAVYGGGRDSTVEGNVAIIVSGTAGSIFGGGYAYAYTDDGAKTAVADVIGDIQISVDGENAQFVSRLFGGGYAYTSSEDEVQQTLQANVEGNINMTINCPNVLDTAEIYGGGCAELVTTSISKMTNRHLTANVTGDITIKIAGDTKGASTGRPNRTWLNLWGGGHADIPLSPRNNITLLGTSATANVTGNITIDAAENQHATSGRDDWDNSMFSKLYGGGHARGTLATANILGDTFVTTSRKVTMSDSGVFGGGYTTIGGTARVTGDTHVRVCRASLQPEGHENGKGVVGGGNGGFHGDATVEGSTFVTIDDNISFEGNNGVGIVGAGRVTEEYGTADVLGSVTINIGQNVTIPGSSAIVGGGCVYRCAHGSALVEGDITILTHEGLSSNSLFIGGGYINSSGASDPSDATVQIGRADTPSKISLSFVGTSSVSKIKFSSLYGGSYVKSAGITSNVYGDITIAFEQLQIKGDIFGSGYAADGACTEAQNVTTTLQDSQSDWLKPGDNATLKDYHLILLGDTTIGGLTKSGTINGTCTVQIGNGTDPANVKVNNYFYTDSIESVSIAQDAVLTGLDSTGNQLLWNVKHLHVDKNGKLIITKHQDIADTCTLSGEGTIVIPSMSSPLVVWGPFTGNITLETADAAPGILAWSMPSETGTFTYTGEGLILTPIHLDSWNRWDLTIPSTTAEVTASVAAPALGGTISPASQAVDIGSNAVVTITRDPGYKIERIMVGTEDQTAALAADNTLTIKNISADTDVTVSFAKMAAEDIHHAADSLPDLSDGNPLAPAEQETILDTKLDYEALEPSEKQSVSDTKRDKLNDALEALSEVSVKLDIQVAGTSASLQEVANLPALLENMTKEEALALKNKETTSYEIIVTVADATPDGDLSASIEAALNGAEKAVQHDVMVTKIITAKDSATPTTTPVTELAKPIKLVFNIPSDLQTVPSGFNRSFTMLRTHGTATTVLPDEDSDPSTYTVSSNLFSTYTLAYRDTPSVTPPTEYPITLPAQLVHGQLSVSSQRAVSGTIVTITAIPDEGYTLDAISATDSAGLALTLSRQIDGSYTFVMPASSVTLAASFASSSSHFSGSSSSSYPISLPSQVANGQISVSSRYAVRGAAVTLTLQPDVGYTLGQLSVTDSKGTALSLIHQADGKLTFIMPPSRVSVSVSFVKQTLPFIDVQANDWFYQSVAEAYEQGLMSGTSPITFAPDAPTTRGMLVTILYRLEGEPTSSGASFDDVGDGQYYAEAISWASANGIVAGYDANHFGPDDAITREQMAAILYRYASFKGYPASKRADLSTFRDADQISPYATDVLSWANAEGLITGMGDGLLNPSGYTTRAQAAAILLRFKAAFLK